MVGLIAISFMLKEGNVIQYMLWFFSLVVLLIIIGSKKGEKPHWNCGKKKLNPGKDSGK